MNTEYLAYNTKCLSCLPFLQDLIKTYQASNPGVYWKAHASSMQDGPAKPFSWVVEQEK